MTFNIQKFNKAIGLGLLGLLAFFAYSSHSNAATSVEPHDPTVLQSGYTQNTVTSYSYPDDTISGLSNSIPPNAVVVEIGYGSDDHDYYVGATFGHFTQTSPGIWGVTTDNGGSASAGVERRGNPVSLNYPPATNSYMAQWGWSSSHTSGGNYSSDSYPVNVCVHVRYRLFDANTHQLLPTEGEAGNCSANGYSVPGDLRGFIRAPEGQFITSIYQFQIGNDAKTRGGIMVTRTLATSSLGARYVSDTLPTTGNVGDQKTGAINMRNDGTTVWTSDQVVPGSQTSNCPDFYNYDPSVGPSDPAETCNDYYTAYSSNYVLKRIDNISSVSTQAEEFPYMQQVIIKHSWTSYCDQYDNDGGGGPGDIIPVSMNSNGFWGKLVGLANHLIFNDALALIAPPGGGGTGECISWVWGDNYSQTSADVGSQATANFPAVHYTGTAPGNYSLRFQMIDKSRSQNFGDVVVIPVTITGQALPLDATISGTTPVSVGNNTTLNWNSSNADSCQQFYKAPGDASYTQLTGGTYGTTAGTSSFAVTKVGKYTFMNQCVSATATPNQINATADVQVNPLTVDATISASTNIDNQGSSTVIWDSPNPAAGTTCTQTYTDPGNQVHSISNTLRGTQQVGPLAGPGTYTFTNTCNNANASPTQKIATATTTVGAPGVLDCSITSSPSSPVPYNSVVTVNWSAPNATTTQIYSETSYQSGNWTPVNGANTQSGSIQTPNITSAKRYMCQANASNTTPTQVNTILTITPAAALPLDAHLDATTPVNVGSSTTLTWSSTNAQSCQVYREQTYGQGNWTPVAGANTTSGTTSYGPFGAAGSYRFLNECQNPNTSPTLYDSPIATVVVNSITLNPPQNVSVDVSVCEQGTVTWTAPNGGTSPTGYKVYRSTDNNTWQLITTSPLSNSTFSYTDHPPVGNYYYAVTAVAGGSESSRASFGPANVHACVVDLSTSDKDVIGNSPVGLSNTPTPCNAVSDPAVLQGGKSFKVNDVVTFRINICNSGDQIAQAVQVTDTLSNVSSPGNYSYSGCASGSASGSGPVTFNVGDVQPHSTCSITFSATITKPASGSIYRFQNIADIKPSNFPNKRVVTPAYLFTDISGTPDRSEIAP